MMNTTRLVRNRTIFLGWAALTLVACAQTQDKHIDVTVQEQGGVFKLVFLNSECPERPNEKGCIQAVHGSSPIISWALDDASSDEWSFSRLQFSPDGKHWGDPAYPLQDCTMQDFNLARGDAQSGVASTARVVADGKRIQIRDYNVNVCTTHYKLVAARRDGSGEIDSDPIIDNKGGGTPP
jgi:hypothetical protein